MQTTEILIILAVVVAFWSLPLWAITDAIRRRQTGWAIGVGVSMIAFPVSLAIAGFYLAVVRRRPELQGSWSSSARPADLGWYPDPDGRHEFRYWDGETWTDAVSDQGEAAVDPPT